MAAATALLVVPLDLNVTDGGFILVQADRVLSGEVPHADFLSVRPAGSTYLHALDFALPGPLFAASRSLAVIEVVAYSALLGLLVFGRRLGGLTAVAVAGLCASALINLQTFPPFAWHTTDGLLLAAAGLLAVERGLARRGRLPVLAGAALCGAAALMKQSFFPVPLLALARIALAVRREPGGVGLVAGSAALAAAPAALYVAAVAAAGGLGAMADQLTGARAVWGQPLVDVLFDAGTAKRMWSAIAIASLSLAGPALLRKQQARRGEVGEVSVWLDALPRAALTVLVIFFALEDGLRFSGLWSFELFWIAALVLSVTSVARRRLDYSGLVVVGFGWMASLSYGVPTPAFVGGSLALYVVVRAWEGFRPPPPLTPLLRAAAAGAALVVAVGFWEARSDQVHLLDREETVLSTELGGIAAPLEGIRSDPATAAYLVDVKRCVRRHPARWTAVLPEDAVSRLAFGLESPFPLDWLWPPEYPGESRDRLIEASRRLAGKQSWLVLFQTVPAGVMQGPQPPALPAAVPTRRPPPFPFDPTLSGHLAAPLAEVGREVVCGSLVGYYRPAA